MLLKLLPSVTLSLWYNIHLQYAEAVDFFEMILVPQGVVNFIDLLSSVCIKEGPRSWSACFVIGFAIFVQGMGEPLNNYKAVVEGTRIMTGRCFGLSPTHITISTVRSLLHVPYSHIS